MVFPTRLFFDAEFVEGTVFLRLFDEGIRLRFDEDCRSRLRFFLFDDDVDDADDDVDDADEDADASDVCPMFASFWGSSTSITLLFRSS